MAFKLSLTVLLLAAALFSSSQVQAAPFNGGEDGGTPTKPANTTLPPSGDQDHNDGGSPTNTTTGTTDSTMTTTTVAPETEVRNSAELTKTAAKQVGSAASILSTYIIENFLTEELVQMSPCFAEMRTAQELDGILRPGTNYLQRIVTDKQALGFFDDYMRNVTAFYNASINENPTCDYCTRFSELKTLTAVLKTNLENLIMKAHLSGLLVDEENMPQQILEEHCRLPCFDNQASIYEHYRIFTMFYVVTDINGFVEQNFDSDKDKQ